MKESPFDPFIARFLVAVQEMAGGYSPQSHGAMVASQLEYDPAFVETLTISARRRSLIEPFYPPSSRNGVRWRISARGKRFLAAINAPEPVPE